MIAGFFIVAIFALGLGLIFATLNVFFRGSTATVSGLAK
jgi:ABC-2 type transport system permease protein